MEETTEKLTKCATQAEKRRISNMTAAMKTRMFFAIRQLADQTYLAKVS